MYYIRELINIRELIESCLCRNLYKMKLENMRFKGARVTINRHFIF